MPRSKLLTSKNFIGGENERSNGDSGNSNSNAGYLSSPVTGEVVIA